MTWEISVDEEEKSKGERAEKRWTQVDTKSWNSWNLEKYWEGVWKIKEVSHGAKIMKPVRNTLGGGVKRELKFEHLI